MHEGDGDCAGGSWVPAEIEEVVVASGKAREEWWMSQSYDERRCMRVTEIVRELAGRQLR